MESEVCFDPTNRRVESDKTTNRRIESEKQPNREAESGKQRNREFESGKQRNREVESGKQRNREERAAGLIQSDGFGESLFISCIKIEPKLRNFQVGKN